ncbi:hypothetical protein ABZ894_26115 [Nocardia beijingensis]|uniref:hypothetical protein n=1 Tax=Nocardia beijingensis TaxID=95162 RepID=UPI003406BB90
MMGDLLREPLAIGSLRLAGRLFKSATSETIMDAFPERLLGVGGAVNDTSIELGGTLGIAIFGSVLASNYRDQIAPHIAGGLPAAAADTAKDSIGGALIVAEKIGHAGMPEQAAQLVSAADAAFAHAVSHTSLIASIMLAVGTVAVAVLLPGRRRPAADAMPDIAKETVSVG